MRPRIAITTGEPAGIGPEISLAALNGAAADAAATDPNGDADGDAEFTLIGDRALLTNRGPVPASTKIDHVPLQAEVIAGTLDARNAGYVLAVLDRAIDGALSGAFDAIVTAPVHKGIINDAGRPFSGHTEYLAQKSDAHSVVMMLVGQTPHGPLRVALATTHLPLAQVPAAITQARLQQVLQVLLNDLPHRFGIADPRIAVTGLNPHAGESGHLGHEDGDVIAPVIERLQAAGHRISGPFPADTVFVPHFVRDYDAVLAMFHDQGLPVLKYATFGHGVNVTLGLPFIRTSVDHGTALDIAARGGADAGSMRAAIALAIALASSRARQNGR